MVTVTGAPALLRTIATAFHWIDPAVRTATAAAAPPPGGALAVVRTRHGRGGTEGLCTEVQRC
ncbi:hypothetical protein [Streptomyces achromogenes]|uniref:hypothetical protein n=1 Tax=Streptomyces achromogenes TaxID=67255 RepID=UPI003865CB63